MKYLKILLGVTVTGIGLLGYLLIGYLVAWWGRSMDPWKLALLGFAGLLATASFAAGVRGIRNGVRWSPPPDVEGQPWLRNEAWRKREILHGSVVHGFYLVLAYICFGVPAALFFRVAFDPLQRSNDHWLEGLVWAICIVFCLTGLTYWWLRHRRYGDSLCRLLTLPGVVGGWFKADVECALPPDPREPVIVRLRNLVSAGRGVREVWRMEQELAVPVSAGKRSVVPVRLRVPRDPKQQLAPRDAGVLDQVPMWMLEIEKRTAGIDFLAKFPVPIYDMPNAPLSEQRTE